MSFPTVQEAKSLTLANAQSFSERFHPLVKAAHADYGWPINVENTETTKAVEEIIETLHKEVFGSKEEADRNTQTRWLKASLLACIRSFFYGEHDPVVKALKSNPDGFHFLNIEFLDRRVAKDLVTHPPGCFITD